MLVGAIDPELARLFAGDSASGGPSPTPRKRERPAPAGMALRGPLAWLRRLLAPAASETRAE